MGFQFRYEFSRNETRNGEKNYEAHVALLRSVTPLMSSCTSGQWEYSPFSPFALVSTRSFRIHGAETFLISLRKLHCRAYKSPTLAPILSHINPPTPATLISLKSILLFSSNLATDYGLDGLCSNPSRGKFVTFPQHPDRLWHLPNLLYNGYQMENPRVKAAFA
jgi:hypothetical protein